jgi:hypothetical protein
MSFSLSYPETSFFGLHTMTYTHQNGVNIYLMNGKKRCPKDCHVVAAAIKTNANLIVTNNLKHFPESYLNSFGLSAKTADDFLTDTIDLNQEQALMAFRELVLNRKNPQQDEIEVLNQLRKAGLKDTADYLHSLI